ncbi:MAG: tyrosine-type recombinase/integrase [Planctomycetota bacterium]
MPGRALGEIATADVERFLTQQALKGRQPATLLRYREILHAFWRWAERQGHVERNVVAPIPRPRLPERDPRFLSLDQIDELLAAVAGDRIGPLVAAAVFGGFRREELCWLTWSDLEADRAPAILRVRAKTVAGESWQP